jgi:glycosyltransferase involved in cell wall biosynthesis
MSETIARVHGSKRTGVLFNGPWECTSSPAAVRAPVRLFFQGFFEDDRNLEALISAMVVLRGRATLTLQGWGGCELALRELVEDLELHDVVTFREACRPTEVVACARDYDIGIVCHRGETLNHEVTVPNKVMDYIGAGLAVAGSDLPGIGSLLEHYGCGMRIDPTDAKTLARDLARMLDRPGEIMRMKNASVAACRELCWERQAAHLVAMYASLAGRA